MPRIAKSLETLRAQINNTYPGRKTGRDGWIGDEAHRARKSDHNPNKYDEVQALDITNDPAHGVVARKLADALLASHDGRIKYIISDGRIGSSYISGGAPAWTWRPYTQGDPHEEHFHVSTIDDREKYNDARPWRFLNVAVDKKAQPDPPKVTLTSKRREMGRVITGYEYDPPLEVFTAPDGSQEIAGISNTHHPVKFAELKRLLSEGRPAVAEVEAADYVIKYTDIVAGWHDNLAIEFYLRDCAFNRGPTGAALILQKAVGVAEDGAVGAATKAAAKVIPVDTLLTKLRAARERYEDQKYPTRRQSNQWAGMVNRWNQCLKDAQQFKGWAIDPVTGALVTAAAAATGGTVVVVTQKDDPDAVSWWGTTIPAAIIVLALAVVVVTLIRRRKS